MTTPLTALLVACSVYPDDALLQAMATANGLNPYSVVDVDLRSGLDSPTRPPTSRQDAERAVGQILLRGGAPVVGLLPVRAEWAPQHRRRLRELFDPCANVTVASQRLADLSANCPRGNRRRCALERYSRAVGLPGLRRLALSLLRQNTATGGR